MSGKIHIYSLLDGKCGKTKLLRGVEMQIPFCMLDVCSCGENISLQSQYFKSTFVISDSFILPAVLWFNFAVYKSPELVCLTTYGCLKKTRM